MSTFAWTLVENLHVYRMLTEVRNIDTGPMRFYHVVGWGIPAIVTGKDMQGSSAGVTCVNLSSFPPGPVHLAVHRRVATPSPRGDGSLWSAVNRWAWVFGGSVCSTQLEEILLQSQDEWVWV